MGSSASKSNAPVYGPPSEAYDDLQKYDADLQGYKESNWPSSAYNSEPEQADADPAAFKGWGADKFGPPSQAYTDLENYGGDLQGYKESQGPVVESSSSSEEEIVEDKKSQFLSKSVRSFGPASEAYVDLADNDGGDLQGYKESNWSAKRYNQVPEKADADPAAFKGWGADKFGPPSEAYENLTSFDADLQGYKES